MWSNFSQLFPKCEIGFHRSLDLSNQSVFREPLCQNIYKYKLYVQMVWSLKMKCHLAKTQDIDMS